MGLLGKKAEDKMKVISTQEQLKQAVKSGERKFVIKGSLVKKIAWMSKIKKAQKVTLIAAITAAAGGVIVPGGKIVSATSLAVAAPMLATAGITASELANLLLASSLGVAIVIGMLRDYDIEVKAFDTAVCMKKQK